MSKKANSKTEQGYEPKPIFAMCSNCKHFRSDKITNEYNYVEEKKTLDAELESLQLRSRELANYTKGSKIYLRITVNGFVSVPILKLIHQ